MAHFLKKKKKKKIKNSVWAVFLVRLISKVLPVKTFFIHLLLSTNIHSVTMADFS